MPLAERLGRRCIQRHRLVRLREGEEVDEWRVLMIRAHVIRTWSSTQPSVTLSSGEAEFYGLVKAAGAGLCHHLIMLDFGLETQVRVWTDSSSATGISTMSGLGKMRHLETHTVWLQEKVWRGAIEVRKVWGM